MKKEMYAKYKDRLITILEYEKESGKNFFTFSFFKDYILECDKRIRSIPSEILIEEDYKEGFNFLISLINIKNGEIFTEESLGIGAGKDAAIMRKFIFYETKLRFETYNQTLVEEEGKIVTNWLYEIYKQWKKSYLNIDIEAEPEPLTKFQKDKIGLLKRSGIIQFLREKNPDINDSQIARFIRELTSENLNNSESIRPHLIDDIDKIKHPFYGKGKINDLDFILNKYGISPQSEF